MSLVKVTDAINPAESPEPHRLGDLLLQRHAISQQQLKLAMAAQKKQPQNALGEILLDMGFIDQRQLSGSLQWQKYLRHATLAVAFTLAPFQMASAAGANKLYYSFGAIESSDYQPVQDLSHLLHGSQYAGDYPGVNPIGSGSLGLPMDSRSHAGIHNSYHITLQDSVLETLWADAFYLDEKKVDLRPEGLNYHADVGQSSFSMEFTYSF